MKNLARFREFIHELTYLIDRTGDDEARILNVGGELLAGPVRWGDWLRDEFAQVWHACC
jgi:hypothetical protein